MALALLGSLLPACWKDLDGYAQPTVLEVASDDGAATESQADAGTGDVARVDLFREDWTQNGPSSSWSGTLRDRGVATDHGFCVRFDGSRWDGTMEYATVFDAPLVVVDLDYSYVVDAQPLAGTTSVGAGAWILASAREWSAVTRAAEGEVGGRLVVDTGGLHGTSAPFDRSYYLAPMRLELLVSRAGLTGSLYARRGGSLELVETSRLHPESTLFDPTRGIRPQLAMSTFFGSQEVCVTGVSVAAVR